MITTISHSLVFILIILYNIYSFIDEIPGLSLETSTVLNYVKKLFVGSGFLEFWIIALIVLIIGYYLIYPIGEACMIDYLGSEEKSGRKSLAKGLLKFFPMFEFNTIMSVFNITTFLIMIGRIIKMDIITEPIIIILLSLRFAVIFSAMMMTPYVKFYIVEKQLPFSEAIKKSMETSVRHLGTTLKYVLIGFILQGRFLFNIIVIIGIPTGLIYLAFALNMFEEIISDYIIYSTTLLLIFIMAYINGIIEAFFLSYRYKVFEEVKE